MGDTKCVWNMGTDCDGDVDNRTMFNQQLTIPACDKHFREHQVVMALHSTGLDIEEVMEMTVEERNTKAEELEIDLDTITC